MTPAAAAAEELQEPPWITVPASSLVRVYFGLVFTWPESAVPEITGAVPSRVTLVRVKTVAVEVAKSVESSGI